MSDDSIKDVLDWNGNLDDIPNALKKCAMKVPEVKKAFDWISYDNVDPTVAFAACVVALSEENARLRIVQLEDELLEDA